MKFKLMNAEKIILDEISNKKLAQNDIAKTYALIIQQGLPVNWQSINQAIVDRWSLAELRKIKELAWSGECFK